jgi:dTDP-glucose 4,6-dehydratase
VKKILITGAGGFIGSHLLELCSEEGYSVKAFVRYNSMNRKGWLDHLSFGKNLEIVSGDIRDYDSVSSALKGCDSVFHLAALIGIPYSYVSPLAYIKTNIEGTYNVLKAAMESKLETILITSTSETYGTAQYVPIDENHPVVGQSPYSASKIGADQLALSFWKSFGLPVKIVRPFNTFGPRQSARAVIPTIITQLINGNEKVMLGSRHPTRDFTYVKDTAKGFMAIARSDDLVGEVTNIGTNAEISIGDLAGVIATLMNKEIILKEDKERIRPEESEVERLLCDNRKILKSTSWKPQFSLDEGLEETIAWFKEAQRPYKSEIYNI